MKNFIEGTTVLGLFLLGSTTMLAGIGWALFCLFEAAGTLFFNVPRLTDGLWASLAKATIGFAGFFGWMIFHHGLKLVTVNDAEGRDEHIVMGRVIPLVGIVVTIAVTTIIFAAPLMSYVVVALVAVGVAWLAMPFEIHVSRYAGEWILSTAVLPSLVEKFTRDWDAYRLQLRNGPEQSAPVHTAEVVQLKPQRVKARAKKKMVA